MAIVISNIAASATTNRFVDLQLDITAQTSSTNNKQNDVMIATDDQATRIRMRNLLLTVPGQMVLDPAYGCNLSQFLFTAVDKRRGYVIGTYIRDQIRKFVPTVQLENVTVVANIDEQQYEIEIAYSNPIISSSPQQPLTGIISHSSGTINFA